MPDLDSVVAAAFADAESGGGDDGTAADLSAVGTDEPSLGEDSSSTESETAEVVAATGADDSTPDGAAADAAAAVSPTGGEAAKKPVAAAKELSEGTKLLEAEGFKATKDNLGRENRIPHSRVVKMVETALKKERDAITATHQTEVTPLKQKAETLDAIDAMIINDPERYIGMLATIHPKLYGKYQRGEAAVKEEPKPAAAAAAASDPEPGPDIRYDDGTVGFSPEQWKKVRAWDRQQAAQETETRLRADLDKRLTPIEQARERQDKERAAQDAHTQRVTSLRDEIAAVRADYGDLFDVDYKAADTGKSEIIAYMAAHPGVSLTRAANAVLVPKIKAAGTADRTKMRGELLDEINGRKKAAVGTPATSGGKKQDGPRSMEQIIKDSIDAAGIR